MANPANRLYSLLSATTALTALTGTRIFPVRAAQDAMLPYIVVRRISGVPFHAMSQDPGVVESMYEVSCYGSSPDGSAGSHAVADQVRGVLDRWSSTTATPDVLNVFIDDESDFWEDTDGLGTFRTVVDVTVQHRTT